MCDYCKPQDRDKSVSNEEFPYLLGYYDSERRVIEGAEIMKVCLILASIVAAVMLPVNPQSAYAQEAAPVLLASVGDETFLFQEIPSVYGASKFEQKIT